MTATPPVAVAVIGLGAIGREVVKAVLARPGLTLVGAADPAFVGRDAGEVAGVGATGVPVRATAAEALAGAAVALVLTASSVSELVPIVDACAAAGVDLVSTCEDLAYAPLVTPELARRIDEQARDAGITVVGTGVNPGLVMDRLPVTLAAACVRVDRIAVTRVVDAAKRRGPLRAKVGAGLTPEEFEAGVTARRLGHRGLSESCALIGLGMGWSFDEIRATIGPVLDPREGIAAGRVAGLRQSAAGMVDGRELVRLDLEMSVAAPEPHDRVVIEGDPPLDMIIRGGTHGDRATVGTVLNAIAPTQVAAPGLRTVLDLALRG
ncbi:MAG TPA: saccharopine dehydrogenase NADP-binding domain-containing protein [Polyangia bacterium]|nr:saccharopine dehydrogenase NADP-binding domain-containing protein [Polyangia bacterium]